MKIFNKLKKLPFNFYNLGEKKILQAILKRKDYSFVIGYYLMVDKLYNQRLGEMLEKGQTPDGGVMDSQIFRKIMGDAIVTFKDKILEI